MKTEAARALPPQDDQLMSQGDELKLQRRSDITLSFACIDEKVAVEIDSDRPPRIMIERIIPDAIDAYHKRLVLDCPGLQ